jgi:N-methylhydantoinase B
MSYELNRRLVARRPPLPTRAEVDPVTAGILRGAFETVCYEVATHLGRCASSAIINQSNERNASILDGQGRLAGISVGIPQLLFISPLAVRYALERRARDDWGAGDVLVGNDPEAGGGHLPDYNVFAPVYDDEGEIVLIQALQAHQGDTGGKDPGGFSVDAREIYAEGLIIPVLKLVHRGAKRDDVIEMLVRNNRLPSFAGDIAAMISAVQMGAARLGELTRKYGADVVRAAVNWNIAETERRFRAEVARWPDGRYEADVWIDHDTAGTRDVHVHVACDVRGDQLTVDMTGSDARPELVCVWNTFSNTRGYAMAQLASMVDPSIPKNEGLFDAVEMIVPEGSILQPPPGKPVALGAFHPAVEVGEAICIALSRILPERSCPQVYKLGMPNAVIGFDAQGRMWMDQGVDVRASDTSATQGLDGWGSMCAGLGNLILATTTGRPSPRAG